MTEKLTFAEVSAVNRSRASRWHVGFPDHGGDWTGGDWSNAMAGECGEACNVVKKLRRVECGRQGSKDSPPAELLVQLGAELADTFIYLDLVATYYGIDLPTAIVHKFNAVSQREGFPERLP